MISQAKTTDVNQDPVLVNDWHVVARSRDLPEGKILKVRVLGEDLIVWRHQDQVMAWKDLCIHRGSRLSLGWIEDGQVVCPYHGWHYNSSGACTLMPAQPNMTPPAKARAFVHRAKEQYDWIWVSLGEQSTTFRLFFNGTTPTSVSSKPVPTTTGPTAFGRSRTSSIPHTSPLSMPVSMA